MHTCSAHPNGETPVYIAHYLLHGPVCIAPLCGPGTLSPLGMLGLPALNGHKAAPWVVPTLTPLPTRWPVTPLPSISQNATVPHPPPILLNCPLPVPAFLHLFYFHHLTLSLLLGGEGSHLAGEGRRQPRLRRGAKEWDQDLAAHRVPMAPDCTEGQHQFTAAATAMGGSQIMRRWYLLLGAIRAQLCLWQPACDFHVTHTGGCPLYFVSVRTALSATTWSKAGRETLYFISMSSHL